jgi:8-oxo-dGTP pyrophosphatase MutT (NUDIX family)
MQRDSLLRGLIREMCKKPKYWGRGGAGIMFRCPEDDTVLLLLRADWVDQGGTWGIPGGGVEEGWFETPIEEPIYDPSIFQRAAFREAVEECGSLPPGFSSSQVTGRTVYEDCGFQYITLIADITLEQKERWRLASNDGETDDFQWVPRSKLGAGASFMGRRLHFGVEYTLSRM